MALAILLVSPFFCLAQSTDVTPPARAFMTQKVPETGKVVVPESPIVSMSGVFEESSSTYICNLQYYYQLQILVYYNLAPTDLLVVVDDLYVDDLGAPWLLAETAKNDQTISARYGVMSNFSKGEYFLSINKMYTSGYDPTSTKTEFSFKVARLGEIVSYELKPASDAYATLDAYLKATDFSGKTATEAAAELTAGLYCKAVDTYGTTWDLLCPVTSWSVDVSKKTASFSPVLVIKEFESSMSVTDINGAPTVNLSSAATQSISFSIDQNASALTETAAPATTVRTEPGAIVVSGAEADVFSLDGRLVGRTADGRLNVAKGFYIVRPDGGESVSVIVK